MFYLLLSFVAAVLIFKKLSLNTSCIFFLDSVLAQNRFGGVFWWGGVRGRERVILILNLINSAVYSPCPNTYMWRKFSIQVHSAKLGTYCHCCLI